MPPPNGHLGYGEPLVTPEVVALYRAERVTGGPASTHTEQHTL